MTGGAVDLHLHSTASDGLLEPAELGRRALAAGLEVLALTDHDTLDGLAELEGVLAGKARLIPALELTCRVRPGPFGTVHVLGYGVDPACDALQEAARVNRLAKRAQIRAVLQQLEEQERVTISWDEVASGRGEDAYVGRHHVASVLVRRGLSRTRRKAFRRFLRSDRVPSAQVVDATQAMDAISAAGGLAVLAHPTDLDLKQHLKRLVPLGLAGIEVHRPRMTPAHQNRIEQAAARHDLLPTGGSDWHGHYPAPPMGDWRPPAGALDGFLARLFSARIH